MPNGQATPPMRGLQAAGPEEGLINQRLGINQAMSGGQPPMLQTPPPRPPAPPGGLQMNPGIPDPAGMLRALQQSGYTGQRTEDIQLPDDTGLDSITARIDALLKGGGR